mmetsp:Transcript_29761/g.70968  ORF Transcript_29761/g.70968 Transcript_29761/m.70968 type:complete len:234 (-) Transcript_29761:118-819(-)
MSGSACEDLLCFDPFDVDCPAPIDFCDGNFDLLFNPEDFGGLETAAVFDSSFGEHGSSSNEANKCSFPEESKDPQVSTCATDFSLQVRQLKGEGQGENFLPQLQNITLPACSKKRKRSSSMQEVEDAAVEDSIQQLEAQLRKLEEENQKMIKDFVTIGDQMQNMMSENQQLKAVLTIYNNTLNSSIKSMQSNSSSRVESATGTHLEDSASETAVSPAVQFLAQVAMLGRSLKT